MFVIPLIAMFCAGAWEAPNVVTSCPKDWFDPKTAGLCVGQAQRGNYGWIMISGVGRV